MSVDGAIVSDLRHVLSEKKILSFFFLVCGPAGSGKSTTLRAVCDGIAACGMRVAYGAPVPTESAQLGETIEWRDENARIFFLDSNMLRSFDADTKSTLEVYPPGTVVFLDDIEAVDYLLRLNASSHSLERIVRLLYRSPCCAFVTSATDVHCVPQWLTDIGAPFTYWLPELTASATRRFLSSLPDVDSFTACFAGGGGETLLSCLRTKRNLMMALCHGRSVSPATRPAISSSALHFIIPSLKQSQSATSTPKLFGLEVVNERVHALVRLFMEPVYSAGRGSLAAAASSSGVLLHGPSGSGKTALAAGLESLCRGRFFFVSCVSLFSKYLGESEERLREAFSEARSYAPSVLVLDDVDVIGGSRGALLDTTSGEGLDVTRRMLAALLCELDGLHENKRVLVIATTNSPNTLDKALLRQGRFETLIYVPPLSFKAAREMAKVFFFAFDCATAKTTAALAVAEARARLSTLVATYAQGCVAVALKNFFRVIFEQQLQLHQEKQEQTQRRGVTTAGLAETCEKVILPLPTEEFVCCALAETDVLTPVKYDFCLF